MYAGVNNVQKSVNRGEGRYLVCPCLHQVELGWTGTVSGETTQRGALNETKRAIMLRAAQQTRTHHIEVHLSGESITCAIRLNSPS